METWYLYMLECADGSIYTGITNDLDARVEKHNAGKGAKYTRGRGPVVLKAYWEMKDKSEALKTEYAYKKLSPKEKLLLIDEFESRK